MAGRRGCMTSLWSGSERVRIGERLKASLAGIVELDHLRCRHWEMIEAVLGRRVTADTYVAQQRGSSEFVTADVATRSHRQQGPSVSEAMPPGLGGAGNSIESRWSTLSWDVPSDPLSPPTPEHPCAAQLDCDSRPSSGFYSVSGSSLSDSCCSVCSEGGAQGVPGGPTGVRGSWGPWDCRPHSADHSASQWQEGRQTPSQRAPVQTESGERRPVSTGELEISGLLFLSDIFSGLGEGSSGPLSNASSHPQLQLDPKFCSDLVSRRTKEVYPYPSPLHAVALQSPLFTSCQDPPSTPLPNPPSSQDTQANGTRTEPEPRTRVPASPSISRLDQYISKLVLKYHSRSASESSSRPGSRKWHPAPGRGSGGLLTSFESHGSSNTTGGSASQRSSMIGSSGSVILTDAGKGGGSCRNSINLGHLPSLNGDSLNLSFHLNLNLNLNPNLNLGLDSKHSKGSSDSCEFLGSDTPTPTPSPSSSSSISTSSAWRGRRKISTCLQAANHRGSLEIKGTGLGPQSFSRSLDWSSASQEALESPVNLGQSSPTISENSAKVCEISRVSGLPRSVIVGLLEEGVELDADCFRGEGENFEWAGARSDRFPSPASNPAVPSHSFSHQTAEHSPSWWNAQLQHPPAQESDQPSHCSPDTRSLSGSVSTPQPHVRSLAPSAQSTPTSHFDRHPSALVHPSTQRLMASPLGSPSDCVPLPPARSSPGLGQPQSPFTPPPLSVFRRSSPSQSSLPRFHGSNSPLEGDRRPRGGSLRQEAGGSRGSGGRPWRRAEGERLYQGKHASRELVRASTVSSYAGRESPGIWEEGRDDDHFRDAPKRGASFRKKLEGLFGGKEKEKEREGGSKMDGEKRKRQSERPTDKEKMGWAEKPGDKENLSKFKMKSSGSRSSGLRPSGTLFRSESQGVLDRRPHRRDTGDQRQQWMSSLEIERAGLGHGPAGLSRERGKAFGGGAEDERLSSTASLFHLSRSQSPEGSCLSLSPLSSPSLSPPHAPAPARLTRSRSFRDLGRRVFGSVKPFSFKTQSLRK